MHIICCRITSEKHLLCCTPDHLKHLFAPAYCFFASDCSFNIRGSLQHEPQRCSQREDINVTYTLLCCTTMLEFLLPCMKFFQFIPCCRNFMGNPFKGWHDMVSQYNMISFCIRKKKRTFLMKLAIFNFLREFVNQHWYIHEVLIACQIIETAHRHMLDGWKEYICDAASCRRFSDF